MFALESMVEGNDELLRVITTSEIRDNIWEQNKFSFRLKMNILLRLKRSHYLYSAVQPKDAITQVKRQFVLQIRFTCQSHQLGESILP